MRYTVLGKRPVSFTASDGRIINGTTIYAGCETEGVEGMTGEKFFVSAEKMPKKEIAVGRDVELYFTKFGKIDAIVSID